MVVMEPLQLYNYAVTVIHQDGSHETVELAALDEASALDVAADYFGPGTRPVRAKYLGPGDIF